MKIKEVLNRNIFYFIILFLLLFFIYGGPSIVKLGLYSDDWDRARLFEFTDAGGFGDKLSFLFNYHPTMIFRGIQFLLYPLSSILGSVVNNQILVMHLFSFFINYVTILVLFCLMRKFIDNPLTAFLFGVFVFTMPGRSGTFFWPSTQVEMFSIMFFFIVLNISLSVGINKWFDVFWIFVFTLLSVWSYEVTIFLPGILLLIAFFKKDKKTIIHFLSSLSAALLVILFKFYMYPKIFNFEVVKKTQSITSLPHMLTKIQGASESLLSKINTLSLFSYWRNYVESSQIFLIAVFLILILLILLFRKGVKIPGKESVPMLIIGLGIIFGFIISITPVFTEGSSFSIYGKNSRFTSLPAMGLGFLICYLFSFSIPSTHYNRILKQILFTILILLNLKGLYSERLAYVKSWVIQRKILDSIDFSAISEDENVMIFVSGTRDLKVTDFRVPVFEDFWTLSLAFSLKTRNPNILADFATYPYDRLDSSGRYQSKYWDKVYYQKNNIYQVDLRSQHPKVIPVRE